MMRSCSYYFEVTVHQILLELCPIKNFHKIFIFTNSYRLHPVRLKIYLLFDHGVEKRILFQDYSTLDNPSYSLHLIKLKLDI